MRIEGYSRQRGASPIARIAVTIAILLIFVTSAGAVGLFVFNKIYQITRNDDKLPDFILQTTGEAAASEIVYEPGKPLPRWEGTERINILVMGIDQREHEEGPWRTDTMMILTLDPVTLSAGMLSIPRDLWVPIPGYNEGRINTAHYLGDAYGYPGGGPALAVKTVQYNIGVPIHHYGRINFPAFEKLIDMIGGIDIYVEEDISDPTYPDAGYGYDPFYIEAGLHHLDGATALKYARTRHTAGGDFDRAKRQQQVITAVFEQVTRLDLLPKLALQAPEMWKMLEDSVKTDLTLDQIIALARLASEVKQENIRYGVIDEHYTQFWTTPDGQQVLIPVRDRMRELRDYIFTADVPLPQQAEDPAARLAQEAAVIKVMNGTTVEGLAGKTAERLRQEGFQVLDPENADRSDYTDTLVIIYTGKNYTAEYLVNLLGLPPTSIIHGSNSSAGYDIALILGANYHPPETPTPTPEPSTPTPTN